MTEEQINKIKIMADKYATSFFPYEKQFLERKAVVKCCVKVVEEATNELQEEIEKKEGDFRKFKADYYELCLLKDMRIDDKDKQIADLEKQNKELQEEITKKSDTNHMLIEQMAEQNEELTEAKEIIGELLGCLQQDTNDPETNFWVVKYIEKAEAFLKE